MRELRPSTRNVLKVYDSALDGARAEGEQWYALARGQAWEMCPDNPRAAAGVIAALSPQTSWEQNLVNAWRLYEGGDPRGLGANLLKALRCYAGEEPLDVLGGPKVRAFFRCIAEPETDAVCVDRHAWDVAVGMRQSTVERVGLTPRRYEEAAVAYRRAARLRDVPPHVVQAVTWVEWRARYGGQKTAWRRGRAA